MRKWCKKLKCLTSDSFPLVVSHIDTCIDTIIPHRYPLQDYLKVCKVPPDLLLQFSFFYHFLELFVVVYFGHLVWRSYLAVCQLHCFWKKKKKKHLSILFLINIITWQQWLMVIYSDVNKAKLLLFFCLKATLLSKT